MQFQAKTSRHNEFRRLPNGKPSRSAYELISIDSNRLEDSSFRGTPMVGGNSGFPFKRSKKLEGNYKDGKVHGMKTEWQENGYKMSETRYENGVKKD